MSVITKYSKHFLALGSAHEFVIYNVLSQERNCQLCHEGVESEEHYVCHYHVFYVIRGRYHCLFKQGFGPLHKVME